ncbi:DUF2294 domain-containing protein [Planomicrobium sp. CPCC 101079]|uniref:DUF2294 domain-containing protein n=1 Tax=Planomicrobium sp. CPCC 101079 TaxID=2599618 RepID=UPI0011B5A7E5|nr:Na-translocating system protein MpsC family protein [Planomicrobium sp. CPCC 101079]TWT09216.1 DUF2294 family protein [Planomicrobium sp. CPCC 101079]
MPKERTIQTELGGYISTVLRKHFGKGPTSVYVTVQRPYLAIHFRGFISPIEKILLKQNEWKRVLKTRDLLVNELKPQILAEIQKVTELEFKELYADWNLPLETGMFLAISDEKPASKNLEWPKDLNKKLFHQKIEQINETAEKKPGYIESYWLSNRTLVMKRSEILVGIEKALIDEGYTEVLKLAKRPLERSLLEQAGLENVLRRDIIETFMDWNFDQDVGFVLFLLESEFRGQK